MKLKYIIWVDSHEYINKETFMFYRVLINNNCVLHCIHFNTVYLNAISYFLVNHIKVFKSYFFIIYLL